MKHERIELARSIELTEGTSLQGEIVATFDDIVEVFGKPHGGDGCKTDVEWELLFEDGTVATIYNWKNGYAYLGTSKGTPCEKITTWNVGGRTAAARAAVASTLGVYRNQ